MPSGTVATCPSAQLAADGATHAFSYRDPATGMMMDAFIVRHGGKAYAWRNQCRHQPLPLDYGDGEFMTEDNRFLLCRNHGALFEPNTGLCVDGPCLNARLHALPATERDDVIEVTLPDAAGELELE